MYDEFIVASTIEREQDFLFLTRILISLSRMTRFHLVYSWIFVNARQTVMKKCDENLETLERILRERELHRLAELHAERSKKGRAGANRGSRGRVH